MECFLCSANLENVKYRHFKEKPVCMTCEFDFVTPFCTPQSTFMIPKTMECFICSANLENVKHRHFKEEPCCMTCEFDFVTASYTPQSTFMIPKAWKKEDWWIKWDKLYYKGKRLDFKIQDAHDTEAYRSPDDENITEDGEIFDCEDYLTVKKVSNSNGANN